MNQAPIFVSAADIAEGDTLCFLDARFNVVVERISVARCDGWIGLHANNDTWSAWYPPTEIKRVIPAAIQHAHQ